MFSRRVKCGVHYSFCSMALVKYCLKILMTAVYRKWHFIFGVYILYFILYHIMFLQRDCDSSCCHIHSTDALNFQKSFRNQVETSFESHYSKNKIFLPKPNLPNHSRWVEISDHIFIYSAFIEPCQQSFLNIYCVSFVGAITNSLPEFSSAVSTIKCAFKFNSGVVWKHGFASVKKLPEAHERNFTAAQIICSLFGVNEESQWPEYASVYQHEKDIVWLRSSLHVPPKNSSQLSKLIALCVRPLYGYISIVSLGEFLAYYSIMGVDHFILYNQKPFGTINSFLNTLNFTNISVEILPWDIPFGESEIHEYGQIVFSQDCVARTRYLFSHTLIVDIDEFVVPKTHRNLKFLLSNLDEMYPQAGSYLFLMSLFCDEYPIEMVKSLPLKILMQSKRQKSVWQPGFRSKYVVKPERVSKVGVHGVWAHEDNMKEIVVPVSTALLHHYKSCCYGRQTWFFHLLSFPVLRDAVIEDVSLLRFENLLTNHFVLQFLLHPERFFPQNAASKAK